MVGGIAGGKTQHLRKKQRKCYAVLNGVLDFTRVLKYRLCRRYLTKCRRCGLM